jgi:ubiquinone/menaquinone biosynthesis C-methylase UbiE
MEIENITKLVQAAYDRIAIEYATVNNEMPLELISLAQELISFVGPAAHILDIGCGHGRDKAWFESKGMTVVGIDLSFGMLFQASCLASSNLCQMDMRRLGFRKGQFRGAWCCASLLHLPKSEISNALKEIHRVMEANGILVLTVQEGKGETWDDGYCEGARRFFARYEKCEIETVVSNNSFYVQKCEVSRQKTCSWLKVVCIAV